MLSANEIKNVRFSKAVGGYKQEEVDVLLDKVEADYEQFERTLREMNNRINELKGELEDCKNTQGNIQNVLISAQKFADQIVEEAKVKSAEIISSAQENLEKITAQEKELATAFDKKAGERKAAYQKDLDTIVASAEKKQLAVERATQDCVDRQQLAFNKMKIEVAAFKAEITAKYKEHLEMLSKIPDTLPADPEEIAKAVSLNFDTMPTIEEYAQNPDAFSFNEEAESEDEPAAEDAVEETEEVAIEDIFAVSEKEESEELEEPAEKLIQSAKGFVINADGFDIDD